MTKHLKWLILFALQAACVARGALTPATVPTAPRSPIGFSFTVEGVADPSTISAELIPDTAPAIPAIQTSPKRFGTDVPFADAGQGAWLAVSAPGYHGYRERVQIDACGSTLAIPSEGAHELCGVTLLPLLPPVPSRDMVLGGHVMFQGGTCDTKDFGVLPWFDAGLFSLSQAGRESVYACKHGLGDTEAFILFDDIHGSIYNEDDNPYFAFQSRHFETDIAGFQDAVREAIMHGFTPKIYLGGDGPDNYPLAVRQFPVAHAALAHAGPTGEDLNQFVKYSPGWDSVFYGWEPAKQKLEAFGKLVRSICPRCHLTMEFNTGHLPQEAEIDMSDYDGFDIEFGAWHDNNTWGIVERLIGPAYVRPADDAPPNDGGDGHPRPWITRSGTPRGPWYTNCFEWATYGWVRNWYTADIVDAVRQYFKSIGCGTPGVPIS